jgi:hypothetical protein
VIWLYVGATPRLGRQVVVTGFVDRYTVPAPAPEYLTLRALAQLTGLHVKVLRGYLTRSTDPLPCYRIGGKTILIKRSDWDVWLESVPHRWPPERRSAPQTPWPALTSHSTLGGQACTPVVPST